MIDCSKRNSYYFKKLFEIMKDLVNYTFGNVNENNLNFHYLRVGNTKPLIDELRKISEIENINYDYHKTDSFQDYNFGSSYKNYDGYIINISINDQNIVDMRNDFWKNYIWKTKDFEQLVALVIPDEGKIGSLTKSEIVESLSLSRLVDRTYEIFQNTNESIPLIKKWLTSMSSIVHRKDNNKKNENK